MKTNVVFYTAFVLSLLLSSCELLNYDGPDAQFHGAIIDEETGDTIPQDIIDGSTIDYIELGYNTPEIQRLIFKVDGTFRNNLMFSGEYLMIPTRGNFFSPDTVDITIRKGDNNYDFRVRPYARINNVSIQTMTASDKEYLVVKFTIDPVASVAVKSIMLSVDKNPNVGRRLHEFFFEKNIGTSVDPDQIQTLWMPLSNFTTGTKYYVRVGALMDLPEAKYNWNKAIRIDPHTIPIQ